MDWIELEPFRAQKTSLFWVAFRVPRRFTVSPEIGRVLMEAGG
jgi:hypothetical protein